MTRTHSRRAFVAVAIGLAAMSGFGVWRDRSRARSSISAANVVVRSGGTERFARLYSPAEAKRSGPALPLIVAFHGIGDAPDAMANYSGLLDLAADGRCRVLFPQAERGMWRTEGEDNRRAETNADMRFVDVLLDGLEGRVAIDRDRIYFAGMSNGATFALMAASASPCRVAAVAAHSGGLSSDYDLDSSDATRRVPVLLLVGDADDYGADESVAATADRLRAAGYEAGISVSRGLGHEWDASKNDRIWRFLSRHRID